MPFRSEKQRRYLWAEHPEIARRWAHKYKNKKDLPMYVNNGEKDKKSDEKEAHLIEKVHTADVKSVWEKSEAILRAYPLFSKKSESILERVEIPHSDKPTYAGQTEVKATPLPEMCEKDKGDKNTAKSLLSKLAVVISPKILRDIEERKALQEARKARYIAQNVNLKNYPVNSGPVIPPPMGMTQPPAPAQPAQPAQPQQQQSAQNTMAPVGGGSNPMANPINAFGALSMTGDINGNAAFGAKNSPESSKVAAAISKWAAASTPCSCGCGATVGTCKCSADCKCRKPGGSCYKGEKQAGKQLGLWDRIRMKRQRGEKPAKPGDKDYPDSKSWNKVTAESEKQSGTPAWQRSEGKNDEGGLNAKGRASYNRATGGHLKAPVTEKNPTGKAKARRHSFCSRMCGMKKHETGSKTKKDPDSRINKALRKWNCKCGSAFEFGKEAAKKIFRILPSWGGQKWQLGEWGVNPQAGYRYLGGVVPTPDLALRLGTPVGGMAVGMDPLPYVEADWGRPSGRLANKDGRSIYQWLGDKAQNRQTALTNSLLNVPEHSTPDDYEAVLRSHGVGYSSKELQRMAQQLARKPHMVPTVKEEEEDEEPKEKAEPHRKAAAKKTGPTNPFEHVARLAVRQYMNKILPSAPLTGVPIKSTAPIMQ